MLWPPLPNQRLHCMFQDSVGWSEKEGQSVHVVGEGWAHLDPSVDSYQEALYVPRVLTRSFQP